MFSSSRGRDRPRRPGRTASGRRRARRDGRGRRRATRMPPSTRGGRAGKHSPDSPPPACPVSARGRGRSSCPSEPGASATAEGVAAACAGVSRMMSIPQRTSRSPLATATPGSTSRTDYFPPSQIRVLVSLKVRPRAELASESPAGSRDTRRATRIDGSHDATVAVSLSTTRVLSITAPWPPEPVRPPNYDPAASACAHQ